MLTGTQFRTSLGKGIAGGNVTIGRAIEILGMGAAKQAAYAIDRMFREE